MTLNFQRKTQRNKPCQIDLLIETKYTVYVCEIKFRKITSKTVINEVQGKIERLKLPKGMSTRPILIYSGGLHPGIEEDGFFDRILHFDELLYTP